MPEDPAHPASRDPSLGPLFRSWLIEIAVYAPLVVIYLLVMLRRGNDFFTRLYHQAPLPYAVAGTFAIVAQGLLLEMLTSWLLRRFGLRH